MNEERRSHLADIVSHGDIHIVKLLSELDLNTAPFFKKLVKEELIEKGKKKVIIDFSECKYLDSYALGVLMSLDKHFKLSGGIMILCGLDSNLKRIFNLTSLNTILSIRKNLNDALQALGAF